MDIFSQLPEDVVSDILSRTSVEDVCKVSLLSKALNSAANSDVVWDKFLPSDCLLILQRSVSPLVYPTKKRLYYMLCYYSAVLIDSGKLCFSLEPKYGKKLYMVSARELKISWGDNSTYWKWISWSSSRFPEVAKLGLVCWLDIRGKINTQMLSTNTNYGVFLVFRLAEGAHGLESVRAVVRLVNDEDDIDAEKRADLLHLQLTRNFGGQQRQSGRSGRTSTIRIVVGVSADEMDPRDQWMEIEMGSFYNGEGGDGEVEARLMEIKNLWSKSGLIIQGIEFRPI